MQEAQVVQALAALAHPMRLRVFRALVVAGPAGLTPGGIQESIEVPPTTLSFHLKELATAGLATVERAGRSLVYRAAYDEMNRLLAYLTRNCCAGSTCVAKPSKASKGRRT
ncbi:MAG: metalloregulator ArsR/SmtB family transcription factor [Myxococcota bacterium]